MDSGGTYSEVGQLEVIVATCHKKVRGFEVGVHDAFVVDHVKS